MAGAVLAVAVVTGLAASPPSAVAAHATQKPATAQSAGAPAATLPTERVFAAEAGLIFNPILPGETDVFEEVVGRIAAALRSSSDPVRQRQAAGWRVYKAAESGPNGSVLYVFVMAPAVAGADYTVSRILADAFPVEAQALYEQYIGSYAGSQSLLNLALVEDFGAVTPLR